MDDKRDLRKFRVGVVMTAQKTKKTIRVEVERLVKHPLYKKYFKRTSSFLVHDEKEECRSGDVVKIMETRPLSRRKHWMVVSVVTKAKDMLAPIPEVEGIDAPVNTSALVHSEGKVSSNSKEDAS